MFWFDVFVVLSAVYIILLMYSLIFSCGGWDRSCGLCWVGIVQAPLLIIGIIVDKIKDKCGSDKK